MPIIELFALAIPEFVATAGPEISAEVLAAQAASTVAPEAIAATEAAAQGATTAEAAQAAEKTAELAPEVSKAAEGITQAETVPGLETAQLKSLTTPQGITQALTAPEATAIPGASGGAGGSGINALQTNAVNQLALGPGPTTAGTTIDTIAGAKPLDVAGLDTLANPVGAQPSSLQMANMPATTSDVSQFAQDRMVSDLIKGNVSQAAPTPYSLPSQVVTETQMPYEIQPPSGDFVSQTMGPQTWSDLPGASEGYSPPSSLQKGFDFATKIANKGLKWVEDNPLSVAGGLYAYMNRPQAPSLVKRGTPSSLAAYKISPDFQAMTPTPTVYKPRYAASGGIMGYSTGGDIGTPENSIGVMDDEPRGDDAQMASGGLAHFAAGKQVDTDYWAKMMEGQRIEDLPESVNIPRTGIMYDTDPDTRYKDALTASLIRMGKINKKANYSPTDNIQRPRFALGQVNLGPAMLKKKQASAGSDDEREAAAGGIMQADHYSMGGYASGDVPRLLKGPGDGMSDDIPASIDGRQPARLADGEFVVPADVVSGLGNGSTDAGAKHLHKMMTDVRRARTGNPKQGKKIMAEKYMPKKKHA